MLLLRDVAPLLHCVQHSLSAAIDQPLMAHRRKVVVVVKRAVEISRILPLDARTRPRAGWTWRLGVQVEFRGTRRRAIVMQHITIGSRQGLTSAGIHIGLVLARRVWYTGQHGRLGQVKLLSAGECHACTWVFLRI